MQANMAMMKRSDAPPGAAAAEKPSGNYIQIPKKYANSKTSPLTITVKSGRNVLDIDLAIDPATSDELSNDATPVILTVPVSGHELGWPNHTRERPELGTDEHRVVVYHELFCLG